MESQTQISASDKSVSENEGIELQVRISSDTSTPEENVEGSVTEHLQEVKSTSDEVVCTLKNEGDISSAETSNVIAELKSESVQDEPRNVSVEKADSLCLSSESNNFVAELKSESVQDEPRNVSVEKADLCLSTELYNTPSYEEKSDTILVDFSDVSQEKAVAHVISTAALTEGEKLETPSNESNFSTSSDNDKDLSNKNRLASSDPLTQQSSNSGNVLKFTEKSSETYNPGTEVKVSRVESLPSLRVKQKDTECGNLEVNADSITKKSETHGDGETISPDELQVSTRFSETAGDGSATIKNSASDVETTAVTKNNGTEGASENANEEKLTNEQSRKPTETASEGNISFKNSRIPTKNAAGENVDDKNSEDIPETAGENVIKEHSNIAAKVEVMHPRRDETVTTEQLPSAKTAVSEAVSNETAVGEAVSNETAVSEAISNETADVGPSETQPGSESMEEDSERRAFFYLSSSSVPGMGKEWEWPSVSSDHHYQRPPRRMERRRNTSESRTCLGTQRCHYIILAVGILGAILGCLTYHLQDYGIGPKVLRPIGASAAFLSFVVCAFSSVYLTYLSYYPQERSSRNYQPLDLSNPVASMLIDTMPQGYNSDPRFYFTSSSAATFQQVFRETQSADALDRRGYSWQQTDIKRPFDEPGPSGYDPESKRIKMDATTSERESYEMKSMGRISKKDQSKERSFSQASDGCHYTLADQADHSNSSEESEIGEKTPLLPKK